MHYYVLKHLTVEGEGGSSDEPNQCAVLANFLSYAFFFFVKKVHLQFANAVQKIMYVFYFSKTKYMTSIWIELEHPKQMKMMNIFNRGQGNSNISKIPTNRVYIPLLISSLPPSQHKIHSFVNLLVSKDSRFVRRIRPQMDFLKKMNLFKLTFTFKFSAQLNNNHQHLMTKMIQYSFKTLVCIKIISLN